jgi:Zn-dependent protease with chaperone function
MQLLLIVAVLAAIVAGQEPTTQGVAYVAWRTGLAVAGMLLVGGAAWLIARHFVKLWHLALPTRAQWLRRLDRAQRLHVGLWLAIVLLTMFALQWPQLVRVNWQLGAWPIVDDLCIFVPVVLPLLLSWAAFYKIEETIAAETSPDAPVRESLARHLWQRVRQQLATLLLPALFLLGLEDLLRLFAPQLLEDRLAWLWAGPTLALLLIGFPLLLKRIWHTEELAAGPLRERLHTLLAERGEQVKNFFVWHTGGRMVNAAVAGCIPKYRYIFLTDRMLAQFSDEQISAVVAHELGHVRGRHLLLRVLAMIVPTLFLAAIGKLLPHGSFPAAVAQQAALAFDLFGGISPTGLLFPLAMILYAALILGKFSRLLELEADYFACTPMKVSANSMLSSKYLSAERTEQYLSSLAQLAATGDTPADCATWLHPSLTTRAGFLLTLLNHPAAAIRFVQQMRLVRVLLIVSLVLGVLVNVLIGA